MPPAPSPTSQSLATLRWTVRAVGDLSLVPPDLRARDIPATVPGCIHTDLIDAGLIPDPAIGDAEDRIQWVSLTDWRYECTFEPDPAHDDHDEIDLVFDCLDTIARIELNGDHIGDAASEFLPHRFPIRGLLNPGRNTLAVTFTSPIRHARAESARLGPRPVNGDWEPYNAIRKCASNFQWDWGPRVATCGLARDLRVEGWSHVRIAAVRPETELLNNTDCMLTIHCEVVWTDSRRSDPVELESRLLDGDTVVASGRGRLLIERAKLWNPRGLGSPVRYTLEVQVLSPATPISGYSQESRVVLATWRGGVGLRAVKPATYYDGDQFFPLIVNRQVPVCRGANWIPEGLFPRDRTPERVRQRLQQLLDANMNTLRIWGGGRYEPDWFYDLCDELGIMVWHDFMFTCACYPEEEPIRSLVEAEARHHVARLARHPCIVLWCGGNENHWAHESWGFKDKLQPNQTWGRHYWNEMLPRIVAELSPATPYLPNSPWSGDDQTHPNDPTRGDHHTWDIKLPHDYRNFTPPFVSEFGWQSPPTLATLREAAIVPSPGPTIPPELARRQRGPGGMTRWFDDPMRALFGDPPPDEPFERWLARAHALQSRYLATYIEWLRIHPDRNRGILIWQLNDAWPGLSWSLIDSAGREKPAYHAVKRALAPRLLTAQPNPIWSLFAINETPTPWHGVAHLTRLGRTDSPRATASIPFNAPPHSITKVAPLAPLLGLLIESDGEHIEVHHA